MSAASQPTYDDAQLILRLYDLRREQRLRKARAWFSSSFRVKMMDDFTRLCPVGSDENASYRMVLTYWEMVASFVTSGVLHKELFFQSGRELLFVWERIRDIVPGIRETTGDGLAAAGIEAVARDFIVWWETRSPGSYAAFSKRVRGE
jgi:hypothetical protein